MVNSFHVTWNRTVNDRPMPFYFSPADLGASVYSPQPGYMGVSVTNGFNIGTGGTNPGYFNSDSLQIANDVDVLLGRHQLSFGGNWIRTKIETVNNRPTNGQFTFNGQSTGLGLADFMLGRVSNFVQGNPVFDFDENDYVGAYVQDEWKLRQNLTLNVGVRWEPYLPIKNSLDYVSNFDEARFDAGIRSTVYPQAPAGLLFPGDDGFPGSAAMKNKLNQFAPRAGLVWQLNEQTALRGGWGRFYDTPHLFFNTRFANNPPWGAQITLTSPPGGFTDPYATYPGGNPFPALATGWMDQPFPTAGVYVNAPLDTRPTTLQQWNLGCAATDCRLAGDGELSRESLQPPVARDRTELRGVHAGRDHRDHERAPAPGAQEPGTGRVLRDHRTAGRHRPRDLSRHAAVGPAPVEGRAQRARQLHAVQVQERSRDDRDHRADHHRPDQSRSRLLVLRLGSPARR